MSRYLSLCITLLISAAAGQLMLTGCSRDMPAYSRFRAIPPEGWAPDTGVIFTPYPRDSVTDIAYTMHLCLRHRLPAQPAVTLVIETEGLDLPQRRDTVTMTLLDQNEDPLGRGAYSVYEIEAPLCTLSPPFPADYTVMLTPLDTLVSITEIGLFLTPR